MPQTHPQTAPSPASKIPTFEEAATQYLELGACHLHPDTIRDHRRVLAQYVFPHIGTLPVSDVTLRHVLDPLRPIWLEKPGQALRAKSLIARVLASAVAFGFRPYTVNLDAIALALPPQPKPMPLLCLPYSEVASVLATVRGSRASPSTKFAFEFLLLTVARSGEVRGAHWEEIDLEKAVWTVPADRLKSRRGHRVPLSTQALAVLAEARELGSGEGPVFPNTRGGPLSASSLSILLRRLGIKVTPHSFRASFRDWCAETGVLHDYAELCLGHSLRGMDNVFCPSVRLVPLRKVMEDWAAYVLPDGFQE